MEGNCEGKAVTGVAKICATLISCSFALLYGFGPFLETRLCGFVILSYESMDC
jgi:hypothetical protein